jgi:hypothetical protein
MHINNTFVAFMVFFASSSPPRGSFAPYPKSDISKNSNRLHNSIIRIVVRLSSALCRWLKYARFVRQRGVRPRAAALAILFCPTTNRRPFQRIVGTKMHIAMGGRPIIPTVDDGSPRNAAPTGGALGAAPMPAFLQIIRQRAFSVIGIATPRKRHALEGLANRVALAGLAVSTIMRHSHRGPRSCQRRPGPLRRQARTAGAVRPSV